MVARGGKYASVAPMDQHPAPERPTTPGERRVLVVLALVFGGLMAAELLSGSDAPLKLSAAFMLLFWGPLIAVHELGHALMARAVGFEVSEVVVGYGRDVWRLRWGGTRITFKTLPVQGHIRAGATRPLPLTGVRHALVFLAGPGIELLLVGFIAAFIGSEELLQRPQAHETGLIAWQALALAATLGAVLNLIPFSIGGRMSDGLGFLLSFTLGEGDARALVAAPYLDRSERLIEEGNAQRALMLVDEGLEKTPGAQRLLLRRAWCLAALGDDPAAVAQLEALGDPEQLPRSERAELLHTGARVALETGDPGRLLDARRLAQWATEVMPTPSNHATLGSVLLRLGRHEAGIEALEGALRGHDAGDLLVDRCFAELALGHLALGHEAEAERYYRGTLDRRPPKRILERVESGFSARGVPQRDEP